MNHDIAATFLPDLLQGRLTGDQRDAVASHAGECQECGELREAYQSLVCAFHEPSDEEHPPSEELTHWVLGTDLLDVSRRSQIALHVKDCASCRMDSEAIRSADAEIDAVPLRGLRTVASPRPYTSFPTRALSVAAAVLIGLLAYPAYLGVLQLMRPPMIRTESAARLQPQFVPMVVLQAPLRGDAASEPVLDIASNQSGAVLAIDPSALIDFADDTRIRFRVSAESTDLLTREVRMRELRVGIQKTGTATLWIPEAVLQAGDHALHVSYGADDGAWLELFSSLFVVNRVPAL